MAQLLVFPIGRAWEKLPRWRVPLGAFTFDVNPGRFTIKEHALIVIVSIDRGLTSTELTDGILSVSTLVRALRMPPDLWWLSSVPCSGTEITVQDFLSCTF